MKYPQPIYFIGIALPPELDKQVAELKWRLYRENAGMLKPVLPHVTLLHPPSLSGIMPSQLIPKVKRVAKNYLPLTIELTSFGSFGEQVFFVGAESLKLYSLQEQLVKLLPPEAQEIHYKRAYLPHITIAQKYEPKKLDLNECKKEAESSLQLPLTFTVDSVTRFTRILPREYRPDDI